MNPLGIKWCHLVFWVTSDKLKSQKIPPEGWWGGVGEKVKRVQVFVHWMVSLTKQYDLDIISRWLSPTCQLGNVQLSKSLQGSITMKCSTFTYLQENQQKWLQPIPSSVFLLLVKICERNTRSRGLDKIPGGPRGNR